MKRRSMIFKTLIALSQLSGLYFLTKKQSFTLDKESSPYQYTRRIFFPQGKNYDDYKNDRASFVDMSKYEASEKLLVSLGLLKVHPIKVKKGYIELRHDFASQKVFDSWFHYMENLGYTKMETIRNSQYKHVVV